MSDALAQGPAQGPGFFGKVRTHGDFVSRRLPVEFLTPWDESLQQGMVFARQLFGAQWLPVYLNAPVWSFAFGAGVCGASAWAGVLMPGVDRVGRYFPFTIAAPARGAEIAGWLRCAQAWYDEAARLALSTLTADFLLERFDAALNAMRLPGSGGAGGSGNSGGSGGSGGSGPDTVPWRLTVADAESAGPDLGDALARCVVPGRSAWWSEGSDAVPASLLVGTGLPDAQRFGGLLDAGCPGWQTVVALRR